MADIESRDLLVLDKKNPESGERYDKEGHVIRVVEWIYEKKNGGKGSSISLEKRTLFIGEGGETRIGKAKGFGRR